MDKTAVKHNMLKYIVYIQPLKMEPIEGTETSAYNNQTPGKDPKEFIIFSFNFNYFQPFPDVRADQRTK